MLSKSTFYIPVVVLLSTKTHKMLKVYKLVRLITDIPSHVRFFVQLQAYTHFK
jgi:hypothetical protein